MIKGFYTGARGVIEYQKMMDVAANNMSNANTDGYKSMRLSFQELLYKRVRMPDNYEANRENYDRFTAYNRAIANGARPVSEEDEEDMEGEPGTGDYFSENKLRVGAGGAGMETALNMTSGSFYETGNQLNAIIEGNGFYAIESLYGEAYYYTKDGSFHVSVEEDANYLVTSLGEYVLDDNYNRIAIPDEANSPRIVGSNLEYSGDINDLRVGIFTCNNIYGMDMAGGNKFLPTDFSGEMYSVENESVRVVPGYLEMSNVSLAEEMVRVMQAQRAFQSNITVVRTADEIEAYTNQMR